MLGPHWHLVASIEVLWPVLSGGSAFPPAHYYFVVHIKPEKDIKDKKRKVFNSVSHCHVDDAGTGIKPRYFLRTDWNVSDVMCEKEKRKKKLSTDTECLLIHPLIYSLFEKITYLHLF